MKNNLKKLLVSGNSIRGHPSTFLINNNEFKIESPLDHLLASLAACEIMTLRYHAKEKNFKINNIKVDKCEATYDLTGFKQKGDGKLNIITEINQDFNVIILFLKV